ncbi:MAG: Cytochrome c oxidase assembly protein CtaG [Alphaproteobacteria bacterium MarineAlpha9_Bin1]|nr:MAG: Cytochrome c oxidase assembly protein CtaG [Alphaproteobacteria bacterium MarineAlpha9_Bin1]
MEFKQNNSTAFFVVLVVFVMVGLSFASVPLYDLFCRTTGFGGTPVIKKNVNESKFSEELTIKVLFNADTAQGLEWNFSPVQREMIVNLGETTLALYEAKNYSENSVTGFATFNVLPLKIGKYFSKIDCFCFEEQTLSGGEKVEMPVSFYIDPKIAEDPNTIEIRTITLSYTFFVNEDNNDKISETYIEEKQENINN